MKKTMPFSEIVIEDEVLKGITLLPRDQQDYVLSRKWESEINCDRNGNGTGNIDALTWSSITDPNDVLRLRVPVAGEMQLIVYSRASMKRWISEERQKIADKEDPDNDGSFPKPIVIKEMITQQVIPFRLVLKLEWDSSLMSMKNYLESKYYDDFENQCLGLIAYNLPFESSGMHEIFQIAIDIYEKHTSDDEEPFPKDYLVALFQRCSPEYQFQYLETIIKKKLFTSARIIFPKVSRDIKIGLFPVLQDCLDKFKKYFATGRGRANQVSADCADSGNADEVDTRNDLCSWVQLVLFLWTETDNNVISSVKLPSNSTPAVAATMGLSDIEYKALSDFSISPWTSDISQDISEAKKLISNLGAMNNSLYFLTSKNANDLQSIDKSGTALAQNPLLFQTMIDLENHFLPGNWVHYLSQEDIKSAVAAAAGSGKFSIVETSRRTHQQPVWALGSIPVEWDTFFLELTELISADRYGHATFSDTAAGSNKLAIGESVLSPARSCVKMFGQFIKAAKRANEFQKAIIFNELAFHCKTMENFQILTQHLATFELFAKDFCALKEISFQILHKPEARAILSEFYANVAAFNVKYDLLQILLIQFWIDLFAKNEWQWPEFEVGLCKLDNCNEYVGFVVSLMIDCLGTKSGKCKIIQQALVGNFFKKEGVLLKLKEYIRDYKTELSTSLQTNLAKMVKNCLKTTSSLTTCAKAPSAYAEASSSATCAKTLLNETSMEI